MFWKIISFALWVQQRKLVQRGLQEENRWIWLWAGFFLHLFHKNSVTLHWKVYQRRTVVMYGWPLVSVDCEVLAGQRELGKRHHEKHLNQRQKKNDDVSVALARLPSIFQTFWRLYKTEARSNPLLLKVSSIRIVFRWISDQGSSVLVILLLFGSFF